MEKSTGTNVFLGILLGYYTDPRHHSLLTRRKLAQVTPRDVWTMWSCILGMRGRTEGKNDLGGVFGVQDEVVVGRRRRVTARIVRSENVAFIILGGLYHTSCFC